MVEERLITEATFKLLMCQQEPLDTENFLVALQFCRKERVPISSEVLLDLCANFVILDTELDVFRFAHLSVREFLEKKEGFDAASNHAIAAECCLQYLVDVNPCYEVYTGDGWITEDEEDPSDQHHATFRNLCHEYTCLYWPLHLSGSSAHRHGPLLEALFWDFTLDDQNFVTRQFMHWFDLSKAYSSEYSLHGWDDGVNRLNYGDIDQPYYGVCMLADLVFVASAWNFCEVLQYCISIDSHVVHLESSEMPSTPLHLACLYGNVDAAKLLLDNGAEMEVTEDHVYTPMMGAIANGHTTVVRLLLEKGANPNSKPTARDDTHLFVAAKCDSIDIVKSLLDAGADPDWGGEYAKTALDMAIYNGNLAMAKMVLDSSGQTNEITAIPWIMASQLIRAAVEGDEDGVSAILRQWPISKMSAQYLNMALWRAAQFNQKTSIRLLLAKGADINSQIWDFPVLFAAATLPDLAPLDERKFPLVRFLLKQGAGPDMNGHGQTLLRRAICWNNLDLARILLEEGADVNQGSGASLPLLVAVSRGFLDAAKLLLQRGADIEKTGNPFPFAHDPDNVLYSALYWARKGEHRRMVQLLLQHGAKDGPESCPTQHEPGSCPYGHGPGVCPHELGRVEDATDETEPFECIENPSDEALLVEREVS